MVVVPPVTWTTNIYNATGRGIPHSNRPTNGQTNSNARCDGDGELKVHVDRNVATIVQVDAGVHSFDTCSPHVPILTAEKRSEPAM